MGRDKSGPEGVRCPFCRGVVTEMVGILLSCAVVSFTDCD